MVPSLGKSDLEQPRTQAELRAWADRVHEQFGRTEEGKRALRLKEGEFLKEFLEEIWPLALFADAFYADATEVLFKPVVNEKESYDALILERPTQRPREYLQITQAFNGYQNHLRMLHFDATWPGAANG